MPERTLKAFFEPNSIAVIGASTNPAKLGYAVLKNLVEDGYGSRGRVYPINPGARIILGQPVYPSGPMGYVGRPHDWLQGLAGIPGMEKPAAPFL